MTKPITDEQVAGVKRFIIGMLGQYGRKWDELTELQQVIFNQDVDKLTSGIIYELRDSIKKVQGGGDDDK